MKSKPAKAPPKSRAPLRRTRTQRLHASRQRKPQRLQASRAPQRRPASRQPLDGGLTPNHILAGLKEMIRGKASVADVARALTEASYLDFTAGKKVYIAHGPGAGYRGTLKEVNNGFAKVEGNMGAFWFCPVIFLQHDGSAPASNAASA